MDAGKIRNWERGDFEILLLVCRGMQFLRLQHADPLYRYRYSNQYMGWGAAVPGQAGAGVNKGLRALSIKMKACLTREEHALLVG